MAIPYQITSMEAYEAQWNKAKDQPEVFWSAIAAHFQWKKPWNKVLEWNFEEPCIRWFEGAQLNITENCLDRHLDSIGDQAALVWEPNDPSEPFQSLSYRELHQEVETAAAMLRMHGIKKGDRVCIYLPMVPELAIAVMACARVGAIHSVVFGGFSAQSIADRINDAQCNLVICSDGAFRGSKTIPMKSTVDDALDRCPSVNKVLVLTRSRSAVSMIKTRDFWWKEEFEKAKEKRAELGYAEVMEAEDPLFILYTSGSTGKPKGVVHTTAGYMVWANYTFVNAFQFQPGDVHFCTADIGWITGHSYILYGPLSAGATSLMFEGVPSWPDARRFWQIVEKHRVQLFYTAPTAIRSLMGSPYRPSENDLSSLRVLGSVGEPINETAWQWYKDEVGGGRLPITDTWWQTETGGIMICPIPGITPEKPGKATLPLPGIVPVLFNEKGEELHALQSSGNLCIKAPWPGMLRTTWGDHERCKNTYFSAYPGNYFTGDGCERDADGYYKITGRVDDVLNVSGHRIGTAELENAINQFTDVVESAVVGYPHEIKGQGIYAFVILNRTPEDPALIKQDILATVSRLIGPIAKPDEILFVEALPKTRSGKIMRRILRKIAEGQPEAIGDTSTLLDPDVVKAILEASQNKP